jgi:catechol 2,3-dioxygenase-like lactoylglutathione lyase family enzyme
MEVDTGRVPTPNLPDHVGVIVKDVHKALDYLSSTYSVKSSQVVGEYSPGNEELVAGRDFAVRIGVVDFGAMKLELLQPLNERSILAEFLRKNGEGLHHIAFSVPDFDKVLSIFKAQGVDMLVGGCHEGRRWVYMDTGSKPGGLITEFMEATES